MVYLMHLIILTSLPLRYLDYETIYGEVHILRCISTLENLHLD